MKILYPYFALKLWADSLLFLIIFSGWILLFALSNNQPLGIIIALILLTITGRYFRKTIKNLYRNLKKLPALELTDDYLIDHVNDIKIRWSYIIKADQISIRGNTFVRFILRDKEKYSEQLKGLLAKIMLKLPDPNNLAIKIELSLVKGKNEEIYNQIYKIFQERKLYNF
ncbi:STM3941 family protein [Flavobacterium phragmitis]|uniref:Uncharacterized protein n=1 Tax=Flavobacterium phragmitis TaxID=739143 RepID=A0A1I1PCT9_9FLAO|nr:STM3941 family protein [Flavobacterium phragmitis]SFD07412.1 hypothetical protein SAMN05216297_10467 [Flavobacterium phragmitis]